MDEAPKRRNQQTVHTKWNRNIAILSGDVLFVKGFQLLAKQKSEHLPSLLDLFNTTAIEVCEGQQLDMDFETRQNVSIPEYIEMIRLKTSVLLGCALEMGAIVANAEKEDRSFLYDFGQHIGIAFQIQDDILDLYADPEKFGKQVGGDVISNKKTLLNLKAFDMADRSQRVILEELALEKDAVLKVQKTRELYDLIGVRSACEAHMQVHYSHATESLSNVNLPKETKLPLIALADFLMNRDI
jgi:geranylgeranyl diphosphate synthase type II